MDFIYSKIVLWLVQINPPESPFYTPYYDYLDNIFGYKIISITKKYKYDNINQRSVMTTQEVAFRFNELAKQGKMV
jgi:hypothetical protein